MPRLAASSSLIAVLLGCDAGPVRDPAAEGDLFVLTTDFESGAFSIVDSAAGTAAVNVGLVHSDATARVFGDRVYVVNRLGQDNVTALDAADGFRLAWQRSTDPGSNPQDIVVVSESKAYVTRLELPTVLVLDPRDGARLGEIDVAALADADGVPEMSGALLVGDRAVLAAGRLDRDASYVPAARGLLAVVDPARDVVERTIELGGENPYGEMALASDGRLLVAEVGLHGVLDGGIEAVDVASGTAGGFLVTEATLGGDVSAFAVAADGALWIVVADLSTVTSLVRRDPADGTTRTLLVGTGYTLSCVAAVAPDLVAVCDRTRSAPGVRLFGQGDGVERTVQPIDVGLPPWQVRALGSR